MNSKLSLLIATGFATSGITFTNTAVAKSDNKGEQRLNVLFFMVDDMNGYGVLDSYPDVITPNIHKLRSQSINFVNNSCPSPVSGPSRTAFFSGLYPHNTGAYRNGCDGWNKNPRLADPNQVETIPECFKRNGYTTWGGGKTFHAPMEKSREIAMFDNKPYKGGFGPFMSEAEYKAQKGTKFSSIKPWPNEKDNEHPDNKNAQGAIDFFNQDHDKPFFMALGLWKPHCPYTAPERFFDLYKDKDLPLPSGFKIDDLDDVGEFGRALVDSLKRYDYKMTKETEGIWLDFIEAYCANYSFADWNIGRVLNALDKSKYADNTIVVFLSDNGYHCGEKMRWEKSTVWEQAAYVPLMIRLPKSLRGRSKKALGVECLTPSNLVDLYPTLVDICGLEPPIQKLDGKSLVDFLENPKKKSDRVSITSYEARLSSVRDERYRLVSYPDNSQELYDLKNDPYEWNNLISDTEYTEVVKRLNSYFPEKYAKSLGGHWSHKPTGKIAEKLTVLNETKLPTLPIGVYTTDDIAIRDPYIVVDNENKLYYLYGATRLEKDRPNGREGVKMYKSEDLVHWTGPYLVYETPENSWADPKHGVWAPEVHKYKGGYYLFATLTNKEKVLETKSDRPLIHARGTQVFHSKSPYGPFIPFKNKPHTPETIMALDGTLWVEDEKPYMIFCHEWIQTTNGGMVYSKMKDDLSSLSGKIYEMFTAKEGEWVRSLSNHNGKPVEGYITDGCFLHRLKSGKLMMIWSSFGENGYAVASAYSDNGKLDGNWIQNKELVFQSNGGHAMMFKNLDGELMLALHHPNSGSTPKCKLFKVEEYENGIRLAESQL